MAVFDRDRSSGALTQKAGPAGGISETGAGGCTDGTALQGPFDLAFSPDGHSVYVAAQVSDAVAVFTREVPAYDIDGNGEVGALTDGLLLLRYMFGFTGATLVDSAVDLLGCTRCTAPAIEAYIEALLDP